MPPNAIKSTEIRSHVESAQRQLRALGKSVPDIDIETMEAQVRADEEELQRPATKADIAALNEKLDRIFWLLSVRQREVRIAGLFSRRVA